MDIVAVRSSTDAVEYFSEEDEEEMALRTSQVQGAYVPPEVIVTSDQPAPPSSRRTSRTKPPQRGGPIRPESPTKVPVQVRGNLQKLGKRLKGWHQRYFEIQGSHMYYYKDHNKKECMGEINLANCYFCDATSAATFGHPFELHTTLRTHTLAARTHDEMVQWVRVIRKNMGTTEEEASVKKAAKPKRWESFKQALSIQPRGKPAAQAPPTKKKPNRKSTFGNKLKLGRSKDRSRSPSPSQGDAHIPLDQSATPTHLDSTRPMSLTENEVGRDTLEILAALQPSRSLPATPLTVKRPIDFNESPSDSPTFQRDSLASPALTLDSTLSTPSHSLTASPAHTVSSPGLDPKHDEVETASEAAERKESCGSSQSIPVLMVTESSIIEADLLNATPSTSELTPHASSEELEASLEEVSTPLASLEPASEPLASLEPASEPLTSLEPASEPLASLEPTSEPLASLEPTSEPLASLEVVSDRPTLTDLPPPTEPMNQIPADLDLPPPTEPVFLTKKYTWDDIREVLDSSEGDDKNDYSLLPPEEAVWLNEETGVEQLRTFLLTCP